MKYTDGSLRNIHGDLWQARFSYRDVPVNDITADMVRTMGQKMLSSGYARETVARAHNALKRFLYLALEEGHISSNAHNQIRQAASSGTQGAQRPG